MKVKLMTSSPSLLRVHVQRAQLMLATGSADSTVRVWDVGEEFMPCADEWTRVKNRSLFNQPQASRDSGRCDAELFDITILENAVVGPDREGNDTSTEGTRQADAAEHTGAAVARENARRAVHALRPEVLRQSGARAAWRTGRVTAVLDQEGMSLNHPTAGETKRKKDFGRSPLIEVRGGGYWALETYAGDGSTSASAMCWRIPIALASPLGLSHARDPQVFATTNMRPAESANEAHESIDL